MQTPISSFRPNELSDAEMRACASVVAEGGAVDPKSAAEELPRALWLAVARDGAKIVGITAIKRARPAYANDVAKKCGEDFPSGIPELGYAAVSATHRKMGIGGRLVEAALAAYGDGPIFATTSNPTIKKCLAAAGFRATGNPWQGNQAELTLWLRA